jgi:hypothetical protein
VYLVFDVVRIFQLNLGKMEIWMKNITESTRIRFFSIFTLCLMLLNITFASDLIPQSAKDKLNKKQSKWSLSFYLAVTSGGPVNQVGDQLRISGLNNSPYRFLANGGHTSLSEFRPQSWLVHMNYKLTKILGLGMSYSNTQLQEFSGSTSAMRTFEDRIGLRNQVQTLSLLLSIYLDESVIIGIGPTYNMTDTPSNNNKVGFIAHLNIRFPLSNTLSISGICQYYHFGNTTIGPYTIENSDNTLSTRVSTNTQIFPPTEISYSHLFIGLGVGIHFLTK